MAAIDDKTLVDRMQTKRLLEVVIARVQTDDCIPPDKRFEFRRADSLADAYQLMTRYPRLTRQVNHHLAARANKLRKERCTPYVLPEIAEEIERHVAKCPVIMTGRPEARLGRAQAFQDNQWRMLRIKPFDRARQTKYLGNALAKELIPENEQLYWGSKADEIRKHQWKDLLGIPLLLNLLKQLAQSEHGDQNLARIHSRYDLYRLAVELLIKKGWDSAEREEDKQALQSPERVFDLLGKVAWYLVRQHQFTGILNPDQY